MRLTGSLHFPHLQLILATSSQAKALPGYRGLSSKGIRILRYLFEDYAFDPDRRELYRGAEVVPIAPQVFDLLDYLIRNRERVVSKDDLINAVWNGRSVSDAALTTRLNVARTTIGDSGEEQRLIKTLPRKGFRFVGTVVEVQERECTAVPDNAVEPPNSALTLPDKPSIAVLPFQNMSGDPNQDYFADGIVDEITTALSRFKSLFVIARNSSFTYKGKAVDIKQIGRELGVRYVLEGSVRKVAGKVRIIGQLIDAGTGVHLWADRFEGDLGDVFTLQDRMTESVVSAIEPKVFQTEIDLATHRTNNANAYDLCLRATPHLHSFTRGGSAEALRLVSRALESDPRYAFAATLAGSCHLQNVTQGWAADPKSEFAEGLRLLQLALSIDGNDHLALSMLGYAAGWSGDFDTAIEIDCTVPTPVVFCLHGLGQTPILFCLNGTGFPGGSGFPAKSDAEGFILVMPLGHQNSWNGTGCCGTAASMQLDDVALMRAIFQEISLHLNVDRRRVFATGLSNGGYMSYRLACQAADLFTAVAPAAGGSRIPAAAIRASRSRCWTFMAPRIGSCPTIFSSRRLRGSRRRVCALLLLGPRFSPRAVVIPPASLTAAVHAGSK